MALQDNFNAIYNKKEQAKQQREAERLQNINFEIQLKELLQLYLSDYIQDHNKNEILLIKTKHQIIDEIIQNEVFYTNCNKYKNINNIKTFLLINYDSVATKTIRLCKLYDKEQEQIEKEQQQKINEIYTLKAIEQQKKAKRIETLRYIGILLLIAPFAIIAGIIKGLGKK